MSEFYHSSDDHDPAEASIRRRRDVFIFFGIEWFFLFLFLLGFLFRCHRLSYTCKIPKSRSSQLILLTYLKIERDQKAILSSSLEVTSRWRNHKGQPNEEEIEAIFLVDRRREKTVLHLFVDNLVLDTWVMFTEKEKAMLSSNVNVLIIFPSKSHRAGSDFVAGEMREKRTNLMRC